MATVKLVQSLINTFTKYKHIQHNLFNTIDTGRSLHQTLLHGYIKQTTLTIPEEIVLLIILFCPSYHPYCQILMNSEYKTNSIYIKFINKTIKCVLSNFRVHWNDQELVLRVPQENSTKEQKLLAALAGNFYNPNYDIIQGKIANTSFDAHKRWDKLLDQVNSSNMGIIGHIKLDSSPYPRDTMYTRVGFNKVNHQVLDLMETAIGTKCILTAIWNVLFSEHEYFKWSGKRDNALNQGPLHWLMNSMDIIYLHDTLKSVDVYFGANILKQVKVNLNLRIMLGNDDYYNGGGNKKWLDLYLTTTKLEMEAEIFNGNAEHFIKIIKDVLLLYESEQTTNEILQDMMDDNGEGWMERDCDISWTSGSDKIIQLFEIVDEAAENLHTEITISGDLIVERI